MVQNTKQLQEVWLQTGVRSSWPKAAAVSFNWDLTWGCCFHMDSGEGGERKKAA
jgi:hypothetical protein